MRFKTWPCRPARLHDANRYSCQTGHLQGWNNSIAAPGKSLTAVEVDRKVAVRYADEMRAWMHLLRATWVELRAKNRQRRLTEPELT
jgi:hypothetical protein